jgi:hypothetical protein
LAEEMGTLAEGMGMLGDIPVKMPATVTSKRLDRLRLPAFCASQADPSRRRTLRGLRQRRRLHLPAA